MVLRLRPWGGEAREAGYKVAPGALDRLVNHGYRRQPEKAESVECWGVFKARGNSEVELEGNSQGVFLSHLSNERKTLATVLSLIGWSLMKRMPSPGGENNHCVMKRMQTLLSTLSCI